MRVQLIIKKREGKWTIDYRFTLSFCNTMPRINDVYKAQAWCERMNRKEADNARLAMVDGHGVHHNLNSDRS